MKKIVTLALALVMALSLAAPALAFTDVAYDPDSDVGISLAIKLVDMTEGYVNVNFNAPPSNRGYVKNEVVCAVVSMFVPKDVDPGDEFDTLVFEGTNVSLYQDANFTAAVSTSTPGSGTGYLRYVSQNVYSAFGTNNHFYYADTNEIVMLNAGLVALVNNSADATYHFAIFGKVLADSASIKATLKGGGAIVNTTDDSAYFYLVEVKDGYGVGYYHEPTLLSAPPAGGTAATISTPDAIANVIGAVDETILFDDTGDGYLYYVEKIGNDGALADADPLFAIVTDKNFKCLSMWVCYDSGAGAGDVWYRINPVSNGGVYADFWGANVQFEYYNSGVLTVLSNTSDIAAILNFICRDVIWNVFGLNPTVSGQMKPEWWASNKVETASIDIEPWYAEVTVPPEIELEIPKTGDAMSALGFVLIALAGLAVVAVRKVKA